LRQFGDACSAELALSVAVLIRITQMSAEGDWRARALSL
jgi:hypothetical protein